jgi:hypothetical protein
MPFADCANTFINSIDIFANYVDKSIDCAQAFYDRANTSINSTNALNTPTSNFCIPNYYFLQLSFNDWFII